MYVYVCVHFIYYYSFIIYVDFKLYLDTYEKSIEKLILAQDTSNVDDTGMSSSEIRERNKKRRRTKAKRKFSSCSSSSENEEVIRNKENCPIQHKTVLPFPKLDKFVSNSTPLKEKSTQHIIENVICDDRTSTVSINNSTIYKYHFLNQNKCYCFCSSQTKIHSFKIRKNVLQRQMYVVIKETCLVMVISL